jgi:hypothetical protein
MKEDLAVFIEALLVATRAVDGHYFQLPVAGAEDPIYRERVYCYELYHQLRRNLPQGFPYVLGGEVDKNGHPILREELGPLKPDFIVHAPGNMLMNLAVVEVKPGSMTPGEFQKDLASFRAFLEHAHYYAAIALIYGYTSPTVLDGHARAFQSNFADLRERQARVLWHRSVGEPAIVLV